MANTVLVKRTTVAGRVPSTAQLAAGELAVNVTDGKLFLKRISGSETVVELGQTGPQGPAGPTGPAGTKGDSRSAIFIKMSPRTRKAHLHLFKLERYVGRQGINEGAR